MADGWTELIVALLTGLTGATLWIGRLLWSLDRRQRDHAAEQQQLAATISALTERLEHVDDQTDRTNTVVERELRPNGGDSLRDRVVRCETLLEQLTGDDHG